MTGARPGRDGGLVRPYVVTCGRSRPGEVQFDYITLVRPSGRGLVRADLALTPEMYRVLDVCRSGALSVAEIAGHLKLPLSVLRIVLTDLMVSGHIEAETAGRPSRGVLQLVLDGLRNLA